MAKGAQWMAVILGSCLGEVGNMCIVKCVHVGFLFLMFLVYWCPSFYRSDVLVAHLASRWRGPGASWPSCAHLRQLGSTASCTAVGTVMLRSQAFTRDRSQSLHRAGTALYFMSGPEAPYYFAINFIPYRTMSHRQKHQSFWHLSASVAQIKHDSLIPKSVLKTVCFNQTA